MLLCRTTSKTSTGCTTANRARGPWLLNGWEFLSLQAMCLEWNVWKELLDGGDFEDSQGEPHGPIVSDWWSAGWIPLTYDGSGNHQCLDLNPAQGGQVGQIIQMWHDDAERTVVANSFREWLGSFADGLEHDEYVMSDEYGSVMRKDEL